jgi:hypothetical protein
MSMPVLRRVASVYLQDDSTLVKSSEVEDSHDGEGLTAYSPASDWNLLGDDNSDIFPFSPTPFGDAADVKSLPPHKDRRLCRPQFPPASGSRRGDFRMMTTARVRVQPIRGQPIIPCPTSETEICRGQELPEDDRAIWLG